MIRQRRTTRILFSLWTHFIHSRLISGCKSDVCFAISMNHEQLGWKRARQSERWPSFARRKSETGTEASAFGSFRPTMGGTHVLIEVRYYVHRNWKKFEMTGKSFFYWKHSLQPRNTESRFKDPGKFLKVCRRVHRSHASLQQHNSNSTSQLNFICCKWWVKDEDLWAGYAST